MAKLMDVVKTIVAGCIVEHSGCRIIQRGDSPQVRAAKKQASDIGRKLTNHRTMQRTLYFLMGANFKPTDFFLTLTFDDLHLPRNRAEAMEAVQRYVRLLRKYRALQGQDVRYIYCIESKHGVGRYHIHMVLNATQKDVEMICSLWDCGMVDWEYIGWSKERGKLQQRGQKAGECYKILARYMTKEVQPVGARNYSHSRGLKRPEVTVTFISEPEAERRKLMETPAGCQQLGYTDYRNEWGRFWSVSYYQYREAGAIAVQRKRPGLYDGETQVILRGHL